MRNLSLIVKLRNFANCKLQIFLFFRCLKYLGNKTHQLYANNVWTCTKVCVCFLTNKNEYNNFHSHVKWMQNKYLFNVYFEVPTFAYMLACICSYIFSLQKQNIRLIYIEKNPLFVNTWICTLKCVIYTTHFITYV